MLDEDVLENLMATAEITCSARPCRRSLATSVQGRRMKQRTEMMQSLAARGR
jgi:hypothetical protein